MLEGVAQTVYSEPANTRGRLRGFGGVPFVDITGVNSPISAAQPSLFGYLTQLDAVCTGASSTIGVWSLLLSSGGTNPWSYKQTVAVSVIGTRYTWLFPVPWKTDTVNASFFITPNVATMGTWNFTI